MQTTQTKRQLSEIEPFTWTHPERKIVSKCDLKIYRRGNGAVIIATERIDDEDSGVSVTNGAEHIATAAMRAYDLDPTKIVWVEHYPYRGESMTREETWDLVQFNYDGERNVFVKPRWLHINRAAAESLILT